MTSNKKVTGRAMTIPAGLAVGAIFSLLVTVAFAAILAKLVEIETIEESGIGYGIMVLLLVASFIGAEVSYAKVKRQRMLVCMLSGLIYLGLLISTTALFFGGQYSAVGVTTLIVMCGSALAMLLGTRQGRGRKGNRFTSAHR